MAGARGDFNGRDEFARVGFGFAILILKFPLSCFGFVHAQTFLRMHSHGKSGTMRALYPPPLPPAMSRARKNRAACGMLTRMPPAPTPQFSALAENIRTSPILEVAAEIDARKRRGEAIDNLTIGDFDANIFAVPRALRDAVTCAYRAHQTNYPGAAGMPQLRESVAHMLRRLCAVESRADNVIIAGGTRPLIYACYRCVLDPGESALYAVPSWNNAAYAALCGAKTIAVEAHAENAFMPRAPQLEAHLRDASLLALCAPQNPTGTVFAEDNLREICEMVLAENRRRGSARKPLYVLFDQVYWALSFDGAFHHPLKVCPQIGDYAVFVDGMSKAYAATGMRVGWANGAPALLAKMQSLIAHMGAWAPRPEQVAAAQFLADAACVDAHLTKFRERLLARLHALYDGLRAMQKRGCAVDAIAPQGGIYLSAKFDLGGGDESARKHLLEHAKVAALPFSWFGAREANGWFRLSVGACERAQMDGIVGRIESALSA